MSYGFKITNNSNQIMVSDSTYNLEFIGKASFIANLGAAQNGTEPPDPSTPITTLLEYRITTNGRSVVPCVYNPNSGSGSRPGAASDTLNFCSIALIKPYSATQYTILLFLSISFPFDYTNPTIYCFCKMNPSSLSGYGMVLFDANGNQTFNTNNSNFINTKGYANAAYVACNPYASGVNPGCSSVTLVTATGATGVTKPAIFFPTQTSGAFYAGYAYGLFFIMAYYNASNQIATRWGRNYCSFFLGGYVYSNPPASSVLTIVVDGADYD